MALFESNMYQGVMFAQEASGGSSALAFLFPLVIMGGLFYILLILPQRRRHKKAEQMRSDIAIGDEVRTIGGIIGVVVDDSGDEFSLDIGGGQRLRVVKKAVAEKLGSDEE